MTDYLSSCCNAPVHTDSDEWNDPDGQTWFYVCDQCDEPCDPVKAQEGS